MALTLRDYQQALVDKLVLSLEEGEDPIACAPTGAGKTVVIAELTSLHKKAGRKVLIGCHRREILLQLIAAITAHLGRPPAVVHAKDKTPLSDIEDDVIVFAIGTLSSRKKKIPDSWIGSRELILDEAHHSTAKTWSGLIDHLQPRTLTGLTATPVSCNSRPLGDVFSTLVMGPSLQWLVDNNYLARPILYAVAKSQAISSAGLRTIRGDYAMAEASKRAAKLLGSSVQVWKDLNPDRLTTLAACCDKVHAQELADAFNDAGIPATSVNGEMPEKERDQAFDDLKTGKISVLTFVALVDEGISIDNVKCILWCRPTKSIRLRRQVDGRAMRLHPDSDTCLIIDQTESFNDLPLPLEDVVWNLDLPGEEGAEAAGRNPAKKKLAQDPESGVVELVDVTAAEFTEIHKNLAPKISTLEELVRDLDPQELAIRCLNMSEYSRMVQLSSFKKSSTASLEDYNAIASAFNFSEDWALRDYLRSVRETSALLKNSVSRQQGQQALELAVRKSIKAGDLSDGILRPGMATFLGVRLGCIHVELNAKLIPREHHAAAQDRLLNALEKGDRIAPFRAKVFLSSSSLTRRERNFDRAISAFDAA